MLKSAPVFLISLVLAALIYWPGLSGAFLFDDIPNIVGNPAVLIEDLSWSSLQSAWNSGVAGPIGRPLAQASFAINHYFSGLNPFAFKASNLAIHLLAAFLAFLLARRITASTPVALLSATIWLLHPIQLTSVLYVVQRMTSLAALFLFLGLLLHIAGREHSAGIKKIALLLTAWLVCWPLGLLSKETAALFPLLVLAWELLVRKAKCGHLDLFARNLLILNVCAAFFLLVYLLLPSGEWLLHTYQYRDFSLIERLMTQARVMWHYLGLLLIPQFSAFGFYSDDIAVSTSLLQPWTTLPAIVGIAVLVASIWLARRRFPILAFGIAWFLLGHALESTIFPLEIAYEHRNYLPSFGIFLALGASLWQIIGRGGWRRTIGYMFCGSALIYCVLLTGMRAHQYGQEIRRTQIELDNHPNSARAQYEAGRAIVVWVGVSKQQSPQYAFARKHYERASLLDPSLKSPLLGLIHLNCQVGVPVESKWLEELQQRLRTSLFSLVDWSVFSHMKEMAVAGQLCLERSQVENLFAAAMANPSVNPAEFHSWLADYYALGLRDYDAAQQQLDKSIGLGFKPASNRLKKVQLLFLQGRHAEALQLLNRLDKEKLDSMEQETAESLSVCLKDSADEKCQLTEVEQYGEK